MAERGQAQIFTEGILKNDHESLLSHVGRAHNSKAAISRVLTWVITLKI